MRSVLTRFTTVLMEFLETGAYLSSLLSLLCELRCHSRRSLPCSPSDRSDYTLQYQALVTLRSIHGNLSSALQDLTWLNFPSQIPFGPRRTQLLIDPVTPQYRFWLPHSLAPADRTWSLGFYSSFRLRFISVVFDRGR